MVPRHELTSFSWSQILRSEGVHAASGSDAKASARSILLRGLNKLRGRAITLLSQSLCSGRSTKMSLT